LDIDSDALAKSQQAFPANPALQESDGRLAERFRMNDGVH